MHHLYEATFDSILSIHVLSYFRFGVILDPWMFSLKEELNLPNTIKQPLLFVNTETFHVATNFNAVKKYTDTTPEECGKRTVYTIRYVYRCFFPEGGVGQSQVWMPACASILHIPQMI
jgi:hypothetical protein